LRLNKTVCKTSSYRAYNFCRDYFSTEARLNQIAGIDRIGRYGDIFSVASSRCEGTGNKRVAATLSNVPYLINIIKKSKGFVEFAGQILCSNKSPRHNMG
jgi:hypothetical protein